MDWRGNRNKCGNVTSNPGKSVEGRKKKKKKDQKKQKQQHDKNKQNKNFVCLILSYRILCYVRKFFMLQYMYTLLLVLFLLLVRVLDVFKGTRKVLRRRVDGTGIGVVSDQTKDRDIRWKIKDLKIHLL